MKGTVDFKTTISVKDFLLILMEKYPKEDVIRFLIRNNLFKGITKEVAEEVILNMCISLSCESIKEIITKLEEMKDGGYCL